MLGLPKGIEMRVIKFFIVSLLLMAFVSLDITKEGSMTIKGEFEVTLNPMSDSDFEAGRMTLDKKYFGAMDGVGKGQMLSHRSSTEGSAGYVAIEHFSGTLEDKLGSFTLQHTGSMQGDDQSLTITVVPDSGSGELVGISGEMSINIVDGKHFYEFSYGIEK
jgi:hypothetical protein